jgi:hypothetical protein
VEALIDSGATANFISRRYVQTHNLAVSAHGQSATVSFPDGSTAQTSSTVIATLRFKNFKFQAELWVVDAPNYDVILGFPWLQQYNPDIDWSTLTMRLTVGPTQFVLHCPGTPLPDFFLSAMDTGVANNSTPLYGPDDAWRSQLQSTLDGYPDVFSEPTGPPPKRAITHRIQLKPGAQPTYRRIYRMSPAEDLESKRTTDDYLQRRWIRPSVSPYASGVLFVPKKEGTLRMVLDYRDVNTDTVKDRYPLPLINDLLDQVQGATIFSKLDLFSGFHQVAMHEDDIPKTAFRTKHGHFEWAVMPMGLTNSPATFQRLMDSVLRDYIGDFVVVYMDDVLVYSKTPHDHILHLQMILEKFRQHSLHCRLSKCAFGKDHIRYLGYIISGAGLHVDPSKTDTIEDWPTPTGPADIASFLGLAGYYRRFVHKFTDRAEPLKILTHKDTPFIWTPAAQAAFDDIKTALTTTPVLLLPDPLQPYEVYADASGNAISAILTQQGRPVCYYSKKLTPAEQNYTTGEQELLAIVAALSEWRCYLHGSAFTVNSDHLNHKTLQTKPLPTKREIRWLEFLQQFDYTIQHVAGTKNPADPLSRRPDYMAALTAATTPTDDTSLLSRVKEAYKDDPDYADAAFVSRLQQTDGLYYYHDRLAIPSNKDLRYSIISELHDSTLSGHLGIDKTCSAVIRRFWWPRLGNTVRDYIRHCYSCQVNKPVNQRPYGLLQPLPTPSYNWQQVTTDMITDLPKTSSGYDSIAVFVDRLSKMVHLAPTTKKVNAPGYAQLFFDYVIKLHGLPEVIISDRDPRFTSKFYTTLFYICGTKLKFSTAYHPQTDGQSERTNRTLEEVLRAYTDPKQNDWDKYLSTAEFAINNSVSPSTGTSPFYANYGQHPKTPLDAALHSTSVPAAADLKAHIDEVSSTIKAKLSEAQDRQQRAANSRRRDISFNTGDQVLLSTVNLKLPSTLSAKFKQRFIGPFKITDKVGQVSYKLELPKTLRIHPVFHVSLLKPYNVPAAQQDSNDKRGPIFEDDKYWEVETLVGKRVIRGVTEYLVRWEGYGPEDDTWLRPADITPDLIKAYNASQHSEDTVPKGKQGATGTRRARRKR